MSGRRGFLAFIGGLAVGGTSVKVQAADRPTLILPPKLVPATTLPSTFPLLASHRCQMDAILHVAGGVSDARFKSWLEAGLQMVDTHRGSA